MREDFEYREDPAPTADTLADGGLILRNKAFLCAPTMRNWMEAPGNSLYPSIPIGSAIMAPAVCEVVASRRDDVPVGTRVMAITSWQDFQQVDTSHDVTPIPDWMGDVDALGLYGINGVTAYIGITRIGRPKAGETVVVSGAAGSTGVTAAQVAKALGCRVIGIAGGKRKCDWLIEEIGLDGAVDYRAGDVQGQLAQLCPQGIDVFYDNVGGEILQAAIENMAVFGRIVLCGQIASYNDDGPVPGPTNMMRLIYGNIRMEGFLCLAYADVFPEAREKLREWKEAGRMIHREDVRPGFEKLPETYNALFDGSNSGTLIGIVEE
ncbi:hypothetical protein NSU_0519 [Novosphingobium pentaromativorans US6-1]|uniref:Enoyl reductase (ER) domain-containing protein n=1 Tax=Novosphingobium pentaromativorans US6-1 TaxID=1088721 RepID=G6E848_9SPHN|nr:hypothetical protein NSU_0519 [Novosphingobium pentaromativorans US6-1]